MAKYYTVVVKEDDGMWYDTYGFTTRNEAQGELESLDIPKSHAKVIVTDGSADELISAVKRLNRE